MLRKHLSVSAIWLFASVLCDSVLAVTLNVPATDADGTYSVSWSGVSPPAGYAHHMGYTAVLQEKVGAGMYSTVRDAKTASSKTFTDKSSNTYTYRIFYDYWYCTYSPFLGNYCLPRTSSSVEKSIVVTLPPPVPDTPPTPGETQTGVLDDTYTITWQKQDRASYYKLQYRRASIGGSYGGWMTYNRGNTFYINQTAKPEGKYQYRVAACNTACSTYSGIRTISVVVAPDEATLNEDGDDSKVGLTDQTFTLNWSASGRVTNFKLYQQSASYGSSSFGEAFEAYSGGGTRKTVTLVDGHHKFYVVACNEYCSSDSNVLQFDVLQFPGEVTPTLSNKTDLADDAYTLSWAAASGRTVEYRLFRRKAANGSTAYGAAQELLPRGPALLRDELNVDPAEYLYYVLACNEAGCGSDADPDTVSVSVLAAPDIPGTVTFAEASHGDRDVDGAFRVDWGLADGYVTHHELERREARHGTSDYSAWTLIHNTHERFEPQENLPDRQYQYRVRACNTYCGGWSEAAQLDVLRVPVAPTAIEARPPDSYGSFSLYVTYPNLNAVVPLVVRDIFVMITSPVSSYVDHYVLEESVDHGETWAPIDCVDEDHEQECDVPWGDPIPMQRPAVDDMGMPQEDYLFRIQACNQSGCSAPSPASSLVHIYPPGTPEGFRSENVSHVTMDADGAYRIAWDLIELDGISYTVEERAAGVDLCAEPDDDGWCATTMGTAHYDVLRTTQAVYEYRIFACLDAVGCGDKSGTPLTVQVAHAPAVPAAPTVTSSHSATVADSSIDGAFTLHWTVPEGTVTSYQLYEDNVPLLTDLRNTSEAFANQPDGNPLYHVVACNHLVCSAGGAGTTVQLLRTPAQLTVDGPSTSDGDGTFTLFWSTPAGAISHYELSRDGGSWQGLGLATSYTESGLGDATYSYSVRACNTLSCAPGSSGKNVTVYRTPGVPGEISCPAYNENTYTLTWVEASGTVTRYELQERFNGGEWETIESSLDLSLDFTKDVTGTYTYQVRACNGPACSAYTDIMSVVVNAEQPNVPPAAGPASAPGADDVSAAVGATTGEFRVDEQGAASYSMRILTVPGIAGATPQLSLNYSSSAGNGILGKGWSLGGVSIITRCNRTVATHGAAGPVSLSQNDAYCLDGMRLIKVAASGNDYEYRTEIDEFSKIIGFAAGTGNPDYFKVWRKNGSVSKFGATTDSKQDAPGTSIAFAWGQSEYADRADNKVNFSYTEHSHGDLLVKSITYAGGRAEISFSYESRLDTRQSYAAGSKFEQRNRLYKIESKNDAITLRTYTLEYQYGSGFSQIKSIKECRGSVCFPSTNFTWLNPSHLLSSDVSVAHVNGFSGAKPADLDGDGFNEVIWLQVDSEENQNLRVLYKDSGVWADLGVSQPTAKSLQDTWTVVDYNNDGRQDLMYQRNNRWHVRMGRPGPALGSEMVVSSAAIDAERSIVADIDSDGLADISFWQGANLQTQHLKQSSGSYQYQSATAKSGMPECAYCWLTSLKPIVADFDGDGQADFLVQQTEDKEQEVVYPPPPGFWAVYINNGANLSLYEMLGLGSVAEDAIRVADINGDGLSDVAYYSNFSDKWFYQVNTGDGFNAPQELSGIVSSYNLGSQFVDFDTDGDADFLYPNGNIWYLKKWTGNGFAEGVATRFPTRGDSARPVEFWRTLFFDADGDGRLESLTGDIEPGGANTIYTTKSNSAGVGEVITEITDGFGAKHHLEYLPLNAVSVYTKSSDAASKNWGSPVFDTTGPVWVVQKASTLLPTAGVNPGDVNNAHLSSTDFRYAGLKIQGGGRGVLGFESIATTDVQTGIVTTTTYRQDFPYTGGVSSVVLETSDGDKLSESINTWAQVSGSDGVSRPYIEKTIERKYPTTTSSSYAGTFTVGTNAQTTITTSTSMDGTTGIYGDIREVKVVTDSGSDKFTRTTLYQYHTLDLPNWHIGLLEKVRVTHNRGDDSVNSITRTREFTHNSDGMLATEIIEPDSALSLTITYDYDSYGNRVKVTQSGYSGPNVGGMTGPTTVDRVTNTAFDSDGHYVDEVTNHYGHKVRQSIVRNEYGAVTLEKDANSVSAVRVAYDTMGREYWRGDAVGGFNLNSQRLCSMVSCPADAHFRVASSAAGGSLSYTFYDVLGREVRTATRMMEGGYAIVAREYDELGRLRFVSEPHEGSTPTEAPLHWTAFTYDALGRLTYTEHADQSSSQVHYDGMTRTVTDQIGKTREETNNAVGELIRVEDHNGGFIAYAFDNHGNLVSSTQGGPGATSVVSTMSFDLFGRKISMVDADMGSWSYAYNAFGELVSQTDALAQTTRMGYDRLGRMVARTDADGADSAWIYDTAQGKGLGRLHIEDLQRGGITPIQRIFAYDSFGRGSTVSTHISRGADTQSYTQKTTYDQFGRVFQSFDGGVNNSGIEYVYNANGYVTHVHEAAYSGGGSPEVYYQITGMDARGNVTSLYKGGTTVVNTYAADTGRLRMTNANHLFQGTLQTMSFDFDAVGNLTEQANNGITETYGYDALHRLTDAYQDGTRTLAMSYDALGNITSKRAYTATGAVDANADIGTYSYLSGTHRVVSARSLGYVTNANGSITNSGGTVLHYTAHGKPDVMQKGTRTVHMRYGPNRNRYQRIDDIGTGQEQVTHYIGNVEKIWRPDGTIEVKRFIGGEAIVTHIDHNAQTRYLLKDHLGSSHSLVDDQGVVVQKMSFDAFGARRQALDYASFSDGDIQGFDTALTTRGYTGHEGMDAVGLVHMNGRVYDPRLGRFLSADPVVQFPHHTQSLNRYSYVLNNPLNSTDPSGYFLEPVGNWLRGVAGGLWNGMQSLISFSGGVLGGVFGGILNTLSRSDSLPGGSVVYAFGGHRGPRRWSKTDQLWRKGFFPGRGSFAGAAYAAFSMAVEGAASAGSHVKDGAVVEISPDEMSNEEQLATQLLADAMRETLADLSAQIRIALDSGDLGYVKELRDVQTAFIKSRIYLRNLRVGATAEAHLHRSGSVGISFDAAEVLSTYRNGSKAYRGAGYTLDLPKGRLGLKALWLHELRHVTPGGYLSQNGTPLGPKALETNADEFARRFYGL